MGTYQRSNFAETTLAAPIITTNGTAITVTSGALFPTVPFLVTIDTEILKCTDKGVGNIAWTVTRGEQSSTAATHLIATAVQNNITAGDFSPFVEGPASAVDTHLAVFDSTTGKLIKDGGVLGSLATGNIILAIEGDSISEGALVPDLGRLNWPLQMGNLSEIFGRGIVHNFAVGGDTADAMRAEYATQAHTVKPTLPGDQGYFFLMAGTNDVELSTAAATIYGYLTTIWAAARSDGFKVIAFTIPPSTAFTVGNGKETIRLALNTLILSDKTLYDSCVYSDVLLPNPSSETYYLDGVHPTPAGSLILSYAVAIGLGCLPFQAEAVDAYGITLAHYRLRTRTSDFISGANITAAGSISAVLDIASVRHVYVGNTLYIGGVAVTPTAAELNVLHGGLYGLYLAALLRHGGALTNLITNGTFEVNTAGWGSDATLTRETGTPLVGTGSLKVASVTGGWQSYFAITGQTVGHRYYLSGLVKTSSAGKVAHATDFGVGSGASADCGTAAQWLTYSYVATGTTLYAGFMMDAYVGGDSMLVDSVVCFDLDV
jgi:lysophospholipase L1-like esterase